MATTATDFVTECDEEQERQLALWNQRCHPVRRDRMAELADAATDGLKVGITVGLAVGGVLLIAAGVSHLMDKKS